MNFPKFSTEMIGCPELQSEKLSPGDCHRILYDGVQHEWDGQTGREVVEVRPPLTVSLSLLLQARAEREWERRTAFELALLGFPLADGDAD